MSRMKGDIVNRVKRLPKPSKTTEALQPIFEAVSNAIHAVQDLFGDRAVVDGRVSVDISILDQSNMEIIVADNGIGLTPDRFEAFCTTDTDFKISRGGKGIGRLLWLDAFDSFQVVSIFSHDGVARIRKFEFRLDPDDQISTEDFEDAPSPTAPSGTIVKFVGLRDGAYKTKFPVRPSTIIKHFGSHFLADFILGRSPAVSLSIDDEVTTFPETVTDFLIETRGTTEINTEDFGTFELSSFIFDKAASADFDGLHQLHFVAGGRTVISRKIDGLLGLSRFGDGDDHVYHGCVAGAFLEERVNQERTHFNFDESSAEEISKICAKDIRENSLQEEVQEFEDARLDTMQAFLADYPSFGFDDPRRLLGRTPANATQPEAFAKALIPHKIRRDLNRKAMVQNVLDTLSSGTDTPEDFGDAVRQAADEVRAEEQRQLTEYILRRKIVLDVLDVLIRRVRTLASGARDHHLEETLHQFICPLKITGDDPRQIEQSDHDLWIVDERLALARYFASDLRFYQILSESESGDRPDVLVWDRVHGLGLERGVPLRRVLLVEFKKPNRQNYDERYLPHNQIMRYLSELKNGTVETFEGERVEIAADCVFHCYVVADIVGDLDMTTRGWQTTSNGRGRVLPLAGDFRGGIEIIEWRDLVSDAKARNLAFVEAAGSSFQR